MTLREVGRKFDTGKPVMFEGRIYKVVGFQGASTENPDGLVDIRLWTEPIQANPKDLSDMPDFGDCR